MTVNHFQNAVIARSNDISDNHRMSPDASALRKEQKEQSERTYRIAMYVFGAIILVLFPACGLFIDGLVDSCTATRPQCDPTYQPLALPEAFGLVPLHIGAAFAFFLSVRRPEAQSPEAEGAIVTFLVVGIVLHVVLGVQFVPAIPYAIAIIPLPILTPYLSLLLLVHELLKRLQARGKERAASGAPPPALFQKPFFRGLAGVPVVLGLYAAFMGAICGSATGGVDAFLKTCSFPLSRLPVPPPHDCHYLCTIAAQGSPRLVKPLRWGVRGGDPIIVNRQLSVANAFEDLLHERWPRYRTIGPSHLRRVGVSARQAALSTMDREYGLRRHEARRALVHARTAVPRSGRSRSADRTNVSLTMTAPRTSRASRAACARR
jgi:hypothetical protein